MDAPSIQFDIDFIQTFVLALAAAEFLYAAVRISRAIENVEKRVLATVNRLDALHYARLDRLETTYVKLEGRLSQMEDNDFQRTNKHV
jgi:hypothetical protein